MTKRRASTIPDEKWERHKEEIISLYRNSTLERVMQLMSQRHGLHASKNQYTRIFKKWGVRRYSNARDWKRIDRCIRKRQSEGKVSHVALYGIPIPQDKLERELARNVSFTDRIFDTKDFDDISLPDGFTILTPREEAIKFPLHNRIIRTDNLPWLLFNQEIQSQTSLQRLLSDSTTFMTGEVSDICGYPIYSPNLYGLETTYAQQDSFFGSIYATASGMDSMTLNLGSMFDPLTDVGLSWDFLLEHQFNEPVGINIGSSSMLINPEVRSAFLSVLLQNATGGSGDIRLLESIYRTYTVEENRVHCYTTFDVNNNHYWNPIPYSTLYQLFSLFIFLVTNNFVRTKNIRDIYVWAKSNSFSWTFTEALKSKSTTIDVFATKLFPAVVQAGDVEMVRKLVSRNVAIDIPVEIPPEHWIDNRYRTVLSLAVGERNMQMVKVLCDLGAKLAVVEMDSMAVKETRASLWSQESIEILRLLLDHGADPECLVSNRPRGYPLIKAASEGCLEAVSLLLAAGANPNLVSRGHGTALQASVAGGHVQVVKALLKAEADVNKVHTDNSDLVGYAYTSFSILHGLQTAIQLAARENHTEIASLLLQSGAFINFCPVLAIDGLGWIDRQFAVWEDLSITDETLPFAFAIQYAAQNNNVLLVHQLLAAGAMVDSRIGVEHGDTPLQIAARLGNVELVSLLLACGADVNAAAAKYNGRTAIQAAAESGNIKIIQMLLDAHANIYASPGWRRGRTVLQAALEKGHINAARRLLLAGADINAKPAASYGLTALQAAVSFGDIEIVKELLSYGAEINAPAEPEKGMTALQAAVRYKNIELLDLLLEAGADVDALPSEFHNMTALQCAASENWLEGVQLLLDYNANVSLLPPYYHKTKGYSALGWAIHNGNHDMIVLLLNRGADPNDLAMNRENNPSTAFLYALSRLRSYEILDLFVKKGGDIDQYWGSKSALDVAIEAPTNVEVVRMMLDLISKTTNNPCDDRIRKSLSWITVHATLPANIELLQLLLGAGADIDATHSDSNQTVLQKSIAYGHLEVVEVLLQNGAEVNTPPTRYRGTPLQDAIEWQGETRIPDLLLEHGADVNAPPSETGGVTALQAAAIRGYLPLAKKLLERGADVAAAPSPSYGRTAINGAAEHGHLDMLQLLLNAYDDRKGLAGTCSEAALLAEKEGHVAIANWLRGYAASRSTSFYPSN